ncbi:MAG TPA: DUF3617 family protein [Steroidobacteraceae bacterium]|nr:DUF3617 family protein [Steroidobacteraceae bacterium]
MKLETRWVLTGSMAAVLAVGSAQATPPIRTGLWEEITTVKRDPMLSRTITTRICLNVQDLARVDQRASQMANNRNCKLENYKHSDRATSTGWACSGKDVSMQGHGEVVYDDSTHFHVSTTQQTTAGGRVINTSLASQSRWLSSECGSVKSLSEYSKK